MGNSLDLHHEQTQQGLETITKVTEKGDVDASISTPPEGRVENKEDEI